MRRRTVVIIGAMLALFVIAVLALRLHQTDLIHLVVVNALVQKAPQSEEGRIRRVFNAHRQAAERQGREDQYLKALFAISQKLEKTQVVDREELEEIFQDLEEEH